MHFACYKFLVQCFYLNTLDVSKKHLLGAKKKRKNKKKKTRRVLYIIKQGKKLVQ